MGRFKITARVIAPGAITGEIVDKRKGERLVRPDNTDLPITWFAKASLCPEICEKAYTADSSGENTPWVPKVGERVRFKIDNPNGGSEFGAAGDEFVVATINSYDSETYGCPQIQFNHPDHRFLSNAPISALEPVVAPATTAEWVDEPVVVVEAEPEAAPKFKVGDKVRCIESSAMGGFVAGEIYEVRSATDGHLKIVRNSHGSTSDGWGEHHFELIEPAAPPEKFKVGDRVVNVSDRDSSITVGGTFQVLGFRSDSEFIQFKDDDGDLRNRPAEFYRLSSTALPINSTVTFTATGRLSAINENGHHQVTFPDLAPGQNSFALPAKYVALAG